MIAPARIKKGTASITKLSRPLKSCCGMANKGEGVKKYNIIIVTDAKVMEIGTPITNNITKLNTSTVYITNEALPYLFKDEVLSFNARIVNNAFLKYLKEATKQQISIGM